MYTLVILTYFITQVPVSQIYIPMDSMEECMQQLETLETKFALWTAHDPRFSYVLKCRKK